MPRNDLRTALPLGALDVVVDNCRRSFALCFFVGKKNGGSTRKRIFPPLPKIQLCAGPHWGPALRGRREKCKSQQPHSRTACVITVTTQPGMLPAVRGPWAPAEAKREAAVDARRMPPPPQRPQATTPPPPRPPSRLGKKDRCEAMGGGRGRRGGGTGTLSITGTVC